MPWYLRKSFGGKGPIRVNLSKSGVGLSFGFTGFRVGVNRRGSYLHAGRHGIYYRKQLSSNSSSSSRQPGSQTSGASEQGALLHEEVVNPHDAVAPETEALLSEINRRAGRTAWATWLSVALVVVLLRLTLSALREAGLDEQLEAVPGLLVVVGGLVCFGVWYLIDRPASITKVDYKLDAWSKRRFNTIRKHALALNQAHLVYEQTAGYESDWKRSGGASETMQTSTCTVAQTNPPFIETNAPVVSIVGKHSVLAFMPDYLLIGAKRGRKVQYGALPYGSLQTSLQMFGFIDPPTKPKDAPLTRYTWQYVRRDGGPDKRFASNRQIPVFQFNQCIISGAGLRKVLLISNAAAARAFATTLAEDAKKLAPPSTKFKARTCPKCKLKFHSPAGQKPRCKKCGFGAPKASKEPAKPRPRPLPQ